MKIAAASLMFLLAALSAHAGSFAGPPPFTNGSPLVTGVDGSYQATARGKNLTGVFRFTYSNGRQTSNPQLPTGNTVASLLTDPYNDYVFFVEGDVYRGLVQANINVNSVAGVLDNGGANIPNFGGGSSTPSASPSPSPSPSATQSFTQTSLTIQAFMNGFFTGCMDQNSPYACFSGKGEVTVNGLVEMVVGEELVLIPDTNPQKFNTVPITEEVVGQISVVKFKFRGVRNATGTSTSSTSTTTGSTTSS